MSRRRWIGTSASGGNRRRRAAPRGSAADAGFDVLGRFAAVRRFAVLGRNAVLALCVALGAACALCGAGAAVAMTPAAALDPGALDESLFGDPFAPDTVTIIDPETRLRWLSDSLRWVWRPGACAEGPRAPYDLPPRPETPALGIVFADGRHARWDPLRVIEGREYWPAERACVALGASLHWSPGSFSGEIEIDTLLVRFAVGSEIVHCGDEARQLPGPVRYEQNRLLLPVEFVSRVVEPLMGERFRVARDPLRLVQQPGGPQVEGFEIAVARDRTVLSWRLPGEPAARLRSDGSSRLAVELSGALIDPLEADRLFAEAAAAGGDAQLCAVRPFAGGTEFHFEIGPDILAWDAEWRESSSEFRVILSPLRQDLTRGLTYRPWPGGPAAPVSGDAQRRVLLVLPSGGETRGLRGEVAEAADRWVEYACALGEQLRDRLRGMDIEVEILEDSRGDPTRCAAQANDRGGFACLLLGPDVCGDRLGADWRVVTAMAAPGGRPMTDLDRGGAAPGARGTEADAGLRLRLWEEVAPQHAAGSEELAWLLVQHADSALRLTGSPAAVSWQRWPTSRLEGLDLPAALLYLGTGRMGAAPDDADWQRLDTLALGLALALDAYRERSVEVDR